jgi:HSP20 family molecular chaperone IbpA
MLADVFLEQPGEIKAPTANGLLIITFPKTSPEEPPSKITVT